MTALDEGTELVLVLVTLQYAGGVAANVGQRIIARKSGVEDDTAWICLPTVPRRSVESPPSLRLDSIENVP